MVGETFEASHVVLMLVVLPLIGAVLVLAFSALGAESIRRTAIVNVWLTCLTAVLLAVQFQAPASWTEGSRAQLRSEIRWLGTSSGPDVRFSVGVDGLSLWFLVLTPAVLLPAVHAGKSVDQKQPALFYASLLVWEGCVLGALAAQDVVLFCVLLEASVVPAALLMGWWGGYERRRLVLRSTLLQIAGGLLVTAGLLAVVVAHARMRVTANVPHPPLCFSLEALIVGGDGIPGVSQWLESGNQSRLQIWQGVAHWAFPLLLLGFAIRVPMPPLHTWFTAGNVELPLAHAVATAGAGVALGGYGLLRFVLPLFPEPVQSAADGLVGAALAGAVYTALLALAQNDLRKLASYACVSHACVCAAGMFSLNATGAAGAVLHLLGAAASTAVLLCGIGLVERRFGTRDLKAYAGLWRASPGIAGLLAAGALSLAGAPLLAGFPGMVLNLTGILQGPPRAGIRAASATLAGMAGLIVAWALVWMLQRMLTGPVRVPSSRESAPESERSFWSAVAPAGVLIAALGLAPQFFLSRIEPAVAACLRAYSTSEPSATVPR